jgi:hypothetical protein
MPCERRQCYPVFASFGPTDHPKPAYVGLGLAYLQMERLHAQPLEHTVKV